MKDNPYMENYDIDVISGRMSLRNPQRKSLEILDKILSNIELEKPDDNGALPHYAENIEKIHSLYPTFTDFEHKFISLAFALATGVGKTRLMGAFITYLYTNYGFKNYFVVAPNITIYDKLRQDLGNLNNEKYVFQGLDCFINSPTIYTEDDYRQKRLQESDIRIFVYNIDKFNSEDLNMRKSTEFLGESFIDKLGNLSDLVVIMDESHHYRAEESAAALSLLKPILALELTATPYVNVKNKDKNKDQEEKGKKSKNKNTQENFKNVVYEYRISKAIADGYTRTPYAMTRENMGHISFGEEEFDRLMLEDGIKWHEHIKEALAAYARVHNKRVVKPFALVVCKNTAHAEQILKFIQSDNFFDGKYRNNVIKIDSKQSKAQREANTKLLLKVERADNPIEIVIHVNVLKEGWDVNNLYTIIPLRAASSKILREQLIGRGLRLPYGERVGDKEIDSVTLTAHDKFNEIIEEAKSGNSIFNAKNIIKAEEIDKEKNTVTQIRLDFETDEDKKAKEDCQQAGIEANEQNLAAVKAINKKIKEKTIEATGPEAQEKAETEIAKESVYELNRDEMFSGAYESDQDVFDKYIGAQVKKIKFEVMSKYIPIPRIGMTQISPPQYDFEDFSLDLSEFLHKPANTKAYLQSLQDSRDSFDLPGVGKFEPSEDPKRLIVRLISRKPYVDYSKCGDIVWKLVDAVYEHYEKQYGDEGVKNIFLLYQKDIVDRIYAQMAKNMTIKEGLYKELVLDERRANYSQNYKSEEEADLYGNFKSDIRKVLFIGIEKGVFDTAKFDSRPELIFARIVDKKSSPALKWLRPKQEEFELKYEFNGEYHDYHPDFVVETEDERFLVEVKGQDKLNDPQVLAKKVRGEEYCKIASEWAISAGSKPWKYLFIPETAIDETMTFDYFANNYGG